MKKSENIHRVSTFDKNKMDLHCHSTFSDGSLSPAQVIDIKSKEGIFFIAIADHDTVGGILEAREYAEKKGMDFIEAIEISSHFGQVQLHILGYGIDITNERLKELCDIMMKDRLNKNERIFDIVDRDFNIDIRREVKKIGKSYIGKPDIARILVGKGYFKSLQETFEKYFKREEIEDIRRITIEAEKALDIIQSAGGFAVLAHPILISGIGKRGSEEFYKNLEKILTVLKNKGLTGIESYYRKNTEKETDILSKLAKKMNLLETRGSDFHG